MIDRGRSELWMAEGTAAFGAAISTLDDDDMRAPSALPGWTRGHVVAHVAHNAEGLTRLTEWARTGHEYPMYPSREARDSQIAESALTSANELRTLVREAAIGLHDGFDQLNGAQWLTVVRLGTGRELAAAELPWFRTRELWIHRVDLGIGLGLDDMPVELQDAMLDDIARDLAQRDDFPGFQVRSVNGESWSLGSSDPVTVTGTPSDLLSWLIGRSEGQGLRVTDVAGPAELPALPPWI